MTESNFEEIFQGWLEKEEYNKNKGFLKKTKYWKKYFCVLRRYDGDENVYLQWFEREEHWRKEFPVDTFALFPKYSVYKRKIDKGKNIFEVSNDNDWHYFMASNEKTMDLWVIQLMMQTRLNASMTENSFRVKGGDGKCLQRIGAKNLNCLLHISEWGITLALERTHCVLSQWPLTTIRNYECTDNNEFVFEAGRKSPMGEGKYQFFTKNSEDNEMFDQLDRFTSLRAKKRRSLGRERLNSGDEEEIAQAYGRLRWSVMLNSSTLNLGVIPQMSSAPQAIRRHDNQYNHLHRQNSSQSTATTIIADSYDRLDRTGSFNDQSSRMNDTSYSRLDCSGISMDRKGSRGTVRSTHDSYDHLERTPSFTGSPSSADSRSRSLGSMEGRSRFQFSSYSSPPPEDNYNHLDAYRRASWSSSPRGTGNAASPESYNRLDRSMMSVQQGLPGNSYDRLDSLQENVFMDHDRGRNPSVRQNRISPPRPPTANDPGAYDVFGNHRNHVAEPYQFTSIPKTEQPTSVEERPPPLPEKPSFMMKFDANNEQLETKQEDKKPIELLNGSNEVKNETNTEKSPNTLPESSTEAIANQSSHYQDLDEAAGGQYESPEPRPRLDTHSSDTDLRKLSMGKNNGTLDRSKRTTLHRSAPSLALYSVVSKKKTDKGSTKGMSKSGSTFKLDSILKRISRGSKKEDPEKSYEKIPRKSKKSERKLRKDSAASVDSSSSLRRLVPESDASMYAEINDNDVSSSSRNGRMERSESKRPLPDLPRPESGIDM